MSHHSRAGDALPAFQIECVSCAKYFTVRPDAVYYQPRNRSNGSNSGWSRPRPQMALERPLVCPRCGADNLGWFQARYAPPPPVILIPGFDLINNPAGRWTRWLQCFGLAGLGLGISLVLMFWAAARYFSLEESYRSTALVLFTLLAGAIPTFSITSRWKEVRDYDQLRRWKKPQSIQDYLPPHWLSGLIHITLFALVLPTILFVVLPFTVQIISSPPPEASLMAKAERLRAQAVALELDLRVYQAEQLANVILSGGPGTPDEAQYKANQDAVRAVVTGLDNLIALLAQTPGANQRPPAESKVIAPDLGYVWTWFSVVGLSSIAAVLLSIAAVNLHNRRASATLPPPIYSNVSNMTRVALDEMKTTLQLAEDVLEGIRWVDAKRNESGGLSLLGVRQEKTRGDDGQPVTWTWSYLVNTDPSVRIQDVEIKNKPAR